MKFLFLCLHLRIIDNDSSAPGTNANIIIFNRVIIRTVFERSDKETASGKMRFIPSFKIVRRAIPAYSELTQIAPELSSMRYCR